MLIRRAVDADAVQACDVMRRSIAELCERDHHGDPAILRNWLGNKTPAIVGGWIADPDNVVFVAVEGDVVLAVGAVKKHGEITLNYVSPDARFRGVSRAMLGALETAAREFGNECCNLTSTETAHRFYLSAGYEDIGMPEGKFGATSSYPMLKKSGVATRPELKMSFAVSDLRERPEFFDAVADRIWQAWWKRRDVPLDHITVRLRENLTGPGIPIALVAHRGDEFLGTASLIVSDLDERPQYAPWVAAVWTEPDARGQGIGRALISRARDEAFVLGHNRVYLCARPAMRSYYLELGWTVLEEDVGARQFTVFVSHRRA